MADVIGPNRYLPGQQLKAVPGVMCDEHPDRVSVARIVGETDSWGSELMDVCQECLDEINKEKETRISDHCEIHNGRGTNVTFFRDPEEGFYGRVYTACEACRVKIINHFVDDSY